MITRALGQSRVDQRRFVDRARETKQLTAAIQGGEPTLVLGEPGSGRTSLLHHVAWRLARGSDPRESVVVSGEIAQDAGQLLGILVARLQRLTNPPPGRGQWLDDLRALTMPDGPFGQVVQPAILMELVDLLGERLDALERPVCLMIDGVAPAVAHAVFGNLRNELWTLDGANWVVAGDAAAGPLYREPPADAFFERLVELGPLPPSDAARLLRAHAVDLAADQTETAITLGAGNPRRLLRAAADLQAGRPPTPAATGELARRAAEVSGPLAGALVEYLDANGPAAASDPGLLSRIGASRQRASQLMHQLESAGLLETLELPHQSGQRGRPARRFAIRESP